MSEPKLVAYAEDYKTCTMILDYDSEEVMYYIRVYPDAPILKLLQELDDLTYSFDSRNKMEQIRESIYKELGKRDQ